jgi:hypothetical protein
VVRVTLVPVSYLSVPSAVHSYGYQDSLFVGWKVYSSSTNKANIYSYSIFVQQMYWLQDKIIYIYRNEGTGGSTWSTTFDCHWKGIRSLVFSSSYNVPVLVRNLQKEIFSVQESWNFPKLYRIIASKGHPYLPPRDALRIPVGLIPVNIHKYTGLQFSVVR